MSLKKIRSILLPKPVIRIGEVIGRGPKGEYKVKMKDGEETTANAAGQELRRGDSVLFSSGTILNKLSKVQVAVYYVP